LSDFIEQNTQLNNEEFNRKKIILESYPQAIFTQMDGPCNHNCLFCSRPETYTYFDLDEFRGNFENILLPVFEKVDRINLTGSGELLFLPEARRNLDYFNKFKHAEKMFATNGSSLTPKMTDFIMESGNNYVIHVSLHAHNAGLHEAMTGNNSFDIIVENLKYLAKTKKNQNKVKINFIFVATTRNIDHLVDFIRFAYEFNADGIIVYYHYIYRQDQKEISCYFKQDLTNRVASLVEKELDKLAKEFGRRLNVSLPPKFKVKYETSTDLCSEPWCQIMINSQGDIISCDVAGDSHENVKGKRDFMEVWNGEYYTNLRKKLIERRYDCAGFCFRKNPNNVNNFRSHVITRGKTEQEMEKLLQAT
jgi:MoaA/NifB/PqqE/SkfB family radical SAM enzyme